MSVLLSALRGSRAGPLCGRLRGVGLSRADGRQAPVALAAAGLLGALLLSRSTGGDLGIAELARMLDMNTSTTHRYVTTLLAVGLLERDPAHARYRLAPEVAAEPVSELAAEVLGDGVSAGRSSCGVPQEGHAEHLEAAAAQARELVVLKARPLVHRVRGPAAACCTVAALCRRRPSSVRCRAVSAAPAAEASWQHAVDDDRVEARARAGAQALLQLERLGDGHLGGLRHRQVAGARRVAQQLRDPLGLSARSGPRARSPRRSAASAASRARGRWRARRAPPGRGVAAAPPRPRVSSQIFTMLTSSLAPGAAAAKYWNVPLEASTRPGDAPAERLQPLQQRPVGVDRDAPQALPQLDLGARAALGARRRTDRRRRRCSPTSTTIVRGPRRAASRPSAAAIVVLPTPPLPVTTSSLRVEQRLSSRHSVSKTAAIPAGPTIRAP